MPVNDELGKRIKENYEERAKTKLVRRMPVIIRIDGKSFHTFTKHFVKPFDKLLMKSMQETMKYLCENIQGCVLGYTQSDEITLVLQDYKELTTDAFFNYEVQKICSIAASMATMKFNQYFSKEVEDLINDADPVFHSSIYTKDYMKLLDIYDIAAKKGAMFDARCFNVPKEEVVNALIYRQVDCYRNAVNSVGQFYFGQKQLQKKSQQEVKDLLTSKDIIFDEFDFVKRFGISCVKDAQSHHWQYIELIFKEPDIRVMIDNLIFYK